MSQSEFLKSCSKEPENIRNDGTYNPEYNSWEVSCLKALLPKYNEYPELLAEIKKLIKEEEVTVAPATDEKTIETYSKETTLGIGAGAAAGGIALGGTGVAVAPMIIRLFSRLF